MKKAKDFRRGQRVKHINHGEGTVTARLNFDEILVDFDIQPKGWDKELKVSANCLNLVNEITRITTIRKDQLCSNCGEKLLKGNKVMVKTSKNNNTITRLYYCLECKEELK
jgi:ribosomal protein L28